MVRRIFSRAASALFVLLVLPGKAHALVPGSVPAPGTMRVFGEGIQMNPVVTASGGIAYSNWHGEPWLKLEGRYQGVFWRDDYRAPEKDAYSLVPGDSANCVQLTGSVNSLACLFDQFDSMAYGSKVWFKPTVTQTLMSTAFQWGRHAKPSIWDDGAPNHRVRLAVSKFEGGNWYIHLMGKQGISSQYWQIVTGGNQEEPAMGRDFVAWEDHRPWEPGLNNRYITFAHEANGYGTSHTIGRGRHPSAGALGIAGPSLVAFEDCDQPGQPIVVYEILGPGAFRRSSWRPACDVARRPVLDRSGHILYLCWNEDRESWDLYYERVEGDVCRVYLDSLGHFPEEDLPQQCHTVDGRIVYSKLDNRASMQFGVWYNEPQALRAAYECALFDEEFGQ